MSKEDQLSRSARQFESKLRALHDALERRILPAFASIQAEGDAIAANVFHELGEDAGPDYDSSEDAMVAQEARFEYFDLMGKVEQSLINAMLVTASHLFEQQLIALVRRVYPPLAEAEADALAKKPRDRFKTMVRDRTNIDVDALPGWAKAEELRMIANTIKHADGPAADTLRQLRPDLLTHPSQRSQSASPVPQSLDFTSFGDNIFVTPAQFAEYVVALCGFWQAFPASFRAGQRPLPW